MWIQVRLDIGLKDLALGLWWSLVSRDRTANQRALEQLWSSGRDDALAALSVRTAFDLLLSELALPPGSEVIFSAITVPDMVRVAEHHRLVPVPVDLTGSDLGVDLGHLREVVTPRSRVLVVAHLFGARLEMDPVLALAREHGLFVVDDRAQAWWTREDRGVDGADATLFSFGHIKTATALGGALMRLRDADLRDRIDRRASRYPVQAQSRFAMRCLQNAAFKSVSTRLGFAALMAIGRLRGMTVDETFARLTAGFPAVDLISQLRRRPCSALLRLMRRRLETYNPGRIERRVENATRIIERLGPRLNQADRVLEDHSYWLFPLETEDPTGVIQALRRAGIYSTQRGRLQVVAGPEGRLDGDCLRAEKLLRKLVLVPNYPELPRAAVDRMCATLTSLSPVPAPPE